jgi:type I restriction enzyme S subunit
MEEQKKLAELLWAANDLKEKYKKAITATDEMLKAKFREMFGENCINVLLSELVDIMDDKRKPLNEVERASMKDGQLYPYCGANGVVDYINAYLTDEELLCIAEDCGSYGPGENSSYIISGKCWVNNHAHVVKPKAGICEIDFLHKYLEIVDLRPYISGTTRQKLTQAKMKEIVCIKPSLCDQRNFVAIAEKAEAAKTELKKSIADIDQVMKGLINQ